MFFLKKVEVNSNRFDTFLLSYHNAHKANAVSILYWSKVPMYFYILPTFSVHPQNSIATFLISTKTSKNLVTYVPIIRTYLPYFMLNDFHETET